MPARRATPRWPLYAVAAAWIALGWLNLARGSAHPGVAYRPWAFDHHSYSDLLAMGGDRYFAGGRPVPYVEDRVEYPPLLALALWLPSFVSGRPLGYFTAGYLLLAACGLLAIAALDRIRGAAAWWLAGTPALFYYAGLNWDLLPIALLTAAVLALERRRFATAGVLVALGTSAKLWPISLLPVAAGVLLRRGDGRALARLAIAAVVVFAAVNVPVAAVAPAGWGWFWRFNAQRGAENSIWEVLRRWAPAAHLASDPAFLNAASGAALAAAVAWAVAAGLRRAAGPQGPADRDALLVRLGAALIVVVWIATNKVWSPQYALWACAAGALAAAPPWLFALHAVLAAVDYHVAFEARASRGLVRYFDATYTAEELVRFAAYAALAAWIARALRRAARAPASAPVRAVDPGAPA